MQLPMYTSGKRQYLHKMKMLEINHKRQEVKRRGSCLPNLEGTITVLPSLFSATEQKLPLPELGKTGR